MEYFEHGVTWTVTAYASIIFDISTVLNGNSNDLCVD